MNRRLSDGVTLTRLLQTESELISDLRNAYCGELAAYLAYDGHYKSLNNTDQKRSLLKIQNDELLHIDEVWHMLKQFDAEPGWLKPKLFVAIGIIASILCHVTGWLAPMYVAMLIERIGHTNYNRMANKAELLGYNKMAENLRDMAKTEKEHLDYFNKLLEKR